MSLQINFKTDLHKIIIGLLIILIVLVLYKRQENAGNTATTAGGLNNFSAEALANIAKVYADTRQTAAFNNITVTSTADIKKSNLMPKGGIIIWSGEQVPAGWGLCDGTTYNAVDGSGTVQSPDLRGRFVLGLGQGTNLTARTKGQTGGAETHKLTTAEIPGHTHAASKSCMGADPAGDASSYTDLRSTHGYNCSDRTDKPIFTNWGNDPSTGTGLGGGTHNNMPPFYVLAYIIKL